ncbi:MAG: GAF domain-containing protein [Dehalococcoidia bacterium]
MTQAVPARGGIPGAGEERCTVRHITEAHLACEREAVRRRREVEGLLAAAERLNGADEPEEVLLGVVEVAVELLAVRQVDIVSNEGDHLLRRHCWSDGVWQPSSFRIPVDGSITGWVAHHRRPYRTAAASEDPLIHRPAIAGRRVERVLAVPVLARDGSVLGVLVLCDRRDGEAFSDDDLRLAQGLAHHAAVALERAHLTNELRQTTRSLALLEQRERIAMDLRDGAIQSLYAIALGLGAYELTADGSAGETGEVLRTAMGQIAGVIQTMRDYIAGLQPPIIGAGALREGLRALATEAQSNALIEPNLDLSVTLPDDLAAEIVASVLHIAREATSNVLRHSRATTLSIRLAEERGRLVLIVGDNGLGLNGVPTRAEGGRGLKNMQERARQLGGLLTVHAAIEGGTELRLETPLDRRTVTA